MQNRDNKYIIFEYDEFKSAANMVKHGLDFKQVQRLWDDSNLLELVSPVSNEPRFLNIGKIDEKYWTAIVTYREKAVRLISVRRARTEEVEAYGCQKT